MPQSKPFVQKVPNGRGAKLEKDFFGQSPDCSPAISFCEFAQGVHIVRESQSQWNWDVKHPSTEMARHLLEEVSRQLNPPGVCLCCALGSALDLYHGVDGFFYHDFYPEDVVTFDLSENSHKKNRQKADFMISRADLENTVTFESLAKHIAVTLVRRQGMR